MTHLLSSRTFLLGSSMALLTLLATLVFGRAWCGWVCPLGTILDLFPLDRWRGQRPSPAEAWRKAKYALLLTIIFAALLGNLTLLVFDPLTILFRSLSIAVWPAVDQIVSAIERLLYQIPPLSGAVSQFDAWIRPAFLPTQPQAYRSSLLFASLFLGVIALNLFAPRFWCRYLCPLGGLLGLVSKFALFRRKSGKVARAASSAHAYAQQVRLTPQRAMPATPSSVPCAWSAWRAAPRAGGFLTPYPAGELEHLRSIAPRCAFGNRRGCDRRRPVPQRLAG